MKELEEMGLTWGEAQARAQDIPLWQSFVTALHARQDKEDEGVSECLPWAFQVKEIACSN